jgi:protease-4
LGIPSDLNVKINYKQMKQFLKYVFATVTGLIIFSILSFLFFITAIIMMVPTAEPIKEKSVLHLKLDGNLIERSQNDLYSFFDKEEMLSIGLDDLLYAIHSAKEDKNINGIYLEPGLSFRAGLASLSELREALLDFKKSGKFIISYSGNYTQGAYYLATTADKVFINSQGMLDFRGITASSVFVKGLLEKLGVDIQVVKVGSYKSAVEPFSRDKMSPENKEQMSLMINTIWKNVLTDISRTRSISEDTLQLAANELLTFRSAPRVLELKMVDSLLYKDQVEDKIKEYLGINENDKITFVKPSDFQDRKLNAIAEVKEKIAVVYAVGDIDNGGGDGIRSAELASVLKKVENDPEVKAVVLRINSPGGSAYGSEQIWRAVSNLKEKKPIIVSMGDYAASGGYYMACNATKIVATPNTITGSIGIYGIIPNVEKLMEKVGLSHDLVKTNPYADMPNIYRALTEEEKNVLQFYVEQGYDLFVKRCADGRNMSEKAIREIAEGRVWTGTSALSLGLVDELGTLQDAIKIAAAEAGISSYKLEELPQKKDWFTQLMNLPQDGMEKIFYGNNISQEIKILNKIRQIDNFQAIMPLDMKIQ